MPQLSVDGKTYDVDTLSDAAKQQLAHVQFADVEVQRLQMLLAQTQTARTAYFAALKELLPKDGETA